VIRVTRLSASTSTATGLTPEDTLTVSVMGKPTDTSDLDRDSRGDHIVIDETAPCRGVRNPATDVLQTATAPPPAAATCTGRYQDHGAAHDKDQRIDATNERRRQKCVDNGP
jgi:hypothetical protein